MRRVRKQQKMISLSPDVMEFADSIKGEFSQLVEELIRDHIKRNR